jgi:hypothetical protein
MCSGSVKLKTTGFKFGQHETTDDGQRTTDYLLKEISCNG